VAVEDSQQAIVLQRTVKYRQTAFKARTHNAHVRPVRDARVVVYRP